MAYVDCVDCVVCGNQFFYSDTNPNNHYGTPPNRCISCTDKPLPSARSSQNIKRDITDQEKDLVYKAAAKLVQFYRDGGSGLMGRALEDNLMSKFPDNVD
tara:strand:+ start:541 stop:840 length:300 start_codon:yes stop_codon:yes gene_type:complete